MIHREFFPLYPEEVFVQTFPRGREYLVALAERVAPHADGLHVIVQLPPVDEDNRATEVTRVELRRRGGRWRLQFVPCPDYCDQITAGIVPSAEDIAGYIQDVIDGASVAPARIDSHEELWEAGVGPEALLDIRPKSAYPTLPLEAQCQEARALIARL